MMKIIEYLLWFAFFATFSIGAGCIGYAIIKGL